MKLYPGVSGLLFTPPLSGCNRATKPRPSVRRKKRTTHVPVIFGNTVNERPSLILYPSKNIRTELDGIQETLGIGYQHSLSPKKSRLGPSSQALIQAMFQDSEQCEFLAYLIISSQVT